MSTRTGTGGKSAESSSGATAVEVRLTQAATLPHVDTTRTHRLHVPSLDGLRAVSIALVFLSHVGLGNIIPGGFGVTVFFCISGYLITTLMRAEFDAAGKISLKNFYLRRALRIFPTFYLVLFCVLALGLSGVLVDTHSTSGLLWQIFHLTNYRQIYFGGHGQLPATTPYWSLAVEEHFYLAFPLVYVAMRKREWSGIRQALCLGTLCLTVLAWRCWLVFGDHVSMNRTYMATDTRIDSILFGCLLAIWYNPVIDKTQIQEKFIKRYAIPMAVAALLLSFVLREQAFRDSFRYSLQGAALFVLIGSAIRFPRLPIFRLLNTKAAEHIGALSYSLYLVHLVVLTVLDQTVRLEGWARGAVAAAIALLIAELLRHAIELPAARLRRRLTTSA